MSDTTTPDDEWLRIEIAKALHGRPDPSVLFDYDTYDKFWEYMASSPAVNRLVQLIHSRDTKRDIEIRINESKDIRKNIEDLGSEVYFALSRIDNHINALTSQQTKESL